MEKLSIQKIKTGLMEADEARAVKYATLKSTTAPKSKEIGTPGNPSTKITKVKQVSVPAAPKLRDNKGKPSIPATEKDGAEIVDTMGRGIFNKSSKADSGPKDPSVKNMSKPNQKTKLSQVSVPANESAGKLDIIKKSDDAATIIDKMERGVFKNAAKADAGPKKPSVAAGPSTAKRPALTQKKADMNRNPSVKVKDPVGPKSDLAMPSDAPKKPSWSTVKGGVIVEVNGKKKAQFDIISESVLNRMVENYQSVGYTVTVRSTPDVAWKRDAELFNLIRESIDAKHNGVMEYAKAYRKEAFKRFYGLVEGNMNGLYESRDDFLVVARDVFKLIESRVENKYLADLEMFEGVVRVQTVEGLEDVEIMTEATSRDMAIRNVQAKIAEEYGFGAEIKHLFIDAKKVDLKAVAPWAPRSVVEAKKEMPDFIKKKIEDKKSESDKKKGKKDEDCSDEE